MRSFWERFYKKKSDVINAKIQKPNEITDSGKSIISSKRIESIKNINAIKNSNNNSNNNTSKNNTNSKMTKSENININNDNNSNNNINNISTNDNIKNNKENNSYIFKSYIEPISQNDQKIISVGLYSDSDKELINQIGEEIDEKTRNISDSTSKKL